MSRTIGYNYIDDIDQTLRKIQISIFKINLNTIRRTFKEKLLSTTFGIKNKDYESTNITIKTDYVELHMNIDSIYYYDPNSRMKTFYFGEPDMLYLDLADWIEDIKDDYPKTYTQLSRKLKLERLKQ